MAANSAKKQEHKHRRAVSPNKRGSVIARYSAIAKPKIAAHRRTQQAQITLKIPDAQPLTAAAITSVKGESEMKIQVYGYVEYGAIGTQDIPNNKFYEALESGNLDTKYLDPDDWDMDTDDGAVTWTKPRSTVQLIESNDEEDSMYSILKETADNIPSTATADDIIKWMKEVENELEEGDHVDWYPIMLKHHFKHLPNEVVEKAITAATIMGLFEGE